jgi:tetratricopeptide (TPR) repeat protein
MSSDKRLAFLENLTSTGKADSFAWYALALEYKGRQRGEDALRTFEALRASDPGYVPTYLMCGTMLTESGRTAEAKTWLEQGLSAAKAKGDGHALSELQGALASLDEG